MRKSLALLFALAVLSAMPAPAIAAFGNILNRTGLTKTFGVSGSQWDLAKIADGYTLGPGQVFINHTPWRGDFGNVPFTKAALAIGNEIIPGVGSQNVLIINAARPGEPKPQGGIISTVDANGNGFKQAYGVFDAYMEADPGEGSWPAFWLDQYNPRTGATLSVEVDIFEAYGQWTGGWHSLVHGWVNGGDTFKNNGIHFGAGNYAGGGTPMPIGRPTINWAKGWHRYTAEIQPVPGNIIFYIDDMEYWRYPTPVQSSAPSGMLVNMALGGGGQNTDGVSNPTQLKLWSLTAWKR
jgi:Glycosyl hydrolases family 16